MVVIVVYHDILYCRVIYHDSVRSKTPIHYHIPHWQIKILGFSQLYHPLTTYIIMSYPNIEP